MLTERQATILNVIIGEYVTSATPVPSNHVARRRGLQVSPATVRNEMAELEEERYILRRHVSGGGIPSDKGYRFYVESLPPAPALTEEEEEYVRARFEEVRRDVERGTRLIAELLSHLAQNIAIATFPKAERSRIKRLELVGLQEAVALLVLVLHEARTKKRLLHLTTAVTQDQLTALSNKLSAVYGGSTRSAMVALDASLSPVERQVLEATNEIMFEEDLRRFEEPQIVGLRHLVQQPEFVAGEKVREIVDVLEDREFLKEALPKMLAGEQFRAVIGEENEADGMQACTVLVSRYGVPDGIGGIVGVLGPTRMEYRRSIGAVRLLSSMMSGLVEELS